MKQFMSWLIKLPVFLSIALFANTTMPMDQLSPTNAQAEVKALVASLTNFDLKDGDLSDLPKEIVYNIFDSVEHKYPWDEVIKFVKMRTVCKRWLCMLSSMDDILKHIKVSPLHFAAMTNNVKAIMAQKGSQISSLLEPDCRGLRAAHYALATKSHRALRLLKMGHVLDTPRQNSEKLKLFVADNDPESLKILCAARDQEPTVEELATFSQNEVTVELEDILSRLANPLVIGEFFYKYKQRDACDQSFSAYLFFAFTCPLEAGLFQAMDNFNTAIPDDFFAIFKGYANPNACDELGRTLLARACYKPGFHQMLTQLLMCEGIDVNLPSKNEEMYTPLHIAAMYNNVQAAQILLGLKDGEGKCRVNVNAKNSDGYTPLQMDLETDEKFGMFNLLLQHGADLNVQAKNGFAPIHFAAQNGAIKMLQVLVDNSTCNIDIVGLDGRTALNVATAFDQDACVKLLLRNKANALCTDEDGETPLHAGARGGSIKSMDELISYSYRIINAPNNCGFAPLHIAAMNVNVKEQLLIKKRACAQLLISKGAAIEVRTKVGDTPLHYAAIHGNVPCIELFINHGARIDVRNNNEAVVKNVHVGGYTPLHYAAHVGKMDSVKKLLELGADIRAKTTLGKTAFEIACEFGHQKVGKYVAERM